MITTNHALAGVIGWPISHSRSPRIHNHWLKLYGISASYLPMAVAPGLLAAALQGLAALGFKGCNITLPHKVDALKLVHEVDANARRVGAINTVVVQTDGSLKGFNNDGYGFIQSLLEGKPDEIRVVESRHWVQVQARFAITSLRTQALDYQLDNSLKLF